MVSTSVCCLGWFNLSPILVALFNSISTMVMPYLARENSSVAFTLVSL